ncbi:hypothetical protein C4D60_Mb05t24620 [Musa balbisiana]|uniref:ATP-dependent RNA helicase n=1 Tax=Musa balbisiana TaxID=52838 RepID=A0A4S8JYL1_MUSBA|nr:hypothetical protein C4D60_Mb05t24620 [Musa balbisiana]
MSKKFSPHVMRFMRILMTWDSERICLEAFTPMITFSCDSFHATLRSGIQTRCDPAKRNSSFLQGPWCHPSSKAQSGTGKTATFCSGFLQQVDYGLVECQALLLAPTGELAHQIEKVTRAVLGDYLGVKVHACVGGISVRIDQRVLFGGVHAVVGTPGRVLDVLRRR